MRSARATTRSSCVARIHSRSYNLIAAPNKLRNSLASAATMFRRHSRLAARRLVASRLWTRPESGRRARTTHPASRQTRRTRCLRARRRRIAVPPYPPSPPRPVCGAPAPYPPGPPSPKRLCAGETPPPPGGWYPYTGRDASWTLNAPAPGGPRAGPGPAFRPSPPPKMPRLRDGFRSCRVNSWGANAPTCRGRPGEPAPELYPPPP